VSDDDPPPAPPAPDGGRLAVVVAMGANFAVGLTKLLGFLITGSGAMLAEFMHSLADTGNQGLLLFGARQAKRGPSSGHPFGSGREEYFWAFVVGLVLFGVGGVVSIVEGVQKLIGGEHELTDPSVALVLLAVAAVIEGISLRTGLRVARQSLGPGVPLFAGLRRSRDPDVTIVVYEDTGALIGLALAFIGISASAITGDALYDALATVAIGLLLCAIAIILVVEMHGLLIGRPASRPDRASLEGAIMSVEGVDGIADLRTEHLGPDDLLVCAVVMIGESADLDRVVEIVQEVDARIQSSVESNVMSYVEPGRVAKGP
jgi:cation diffusion facilitator family transporter